MLEIYEIALSQSARLQFIRLARPCLIYAMHVRASNHSSNFGCAAASEKQVFDKGGACQSQYGVGQEPACHHEPPT
jgi:hypothetical protein